MLEFVFLLACSIWRSGSNKHQCWLQRSQCIFYRIFIRWHWWFQSFALKEGGGGGAYRLQKNLFYSSSCLVPQSCLSHHINSKWIHNHIFLAIFNNSEISMWYCRLCPGWHMCYLFYTLKYTLRDLGNTCGEWFTYAQYFMILLSVAFLD